MTFINWYPWWALAAGLLVSPVIQRLITHWPALRPLSDPSRCPRCGASVPWGGAIPGLGWVVRWARPSCGHPPPWQEGLTPLVCGGGGALAVWLAAPIPAGWAGLSQLLLLLWLAYPLAMVDLLTLTVETRLVVLGLTLRMGWLLAFGRGELPDMVLGMLAGAGLMALTGVFYETLRGRAGLGDGDASVMGLVGGFVGLGGLIPALGLAAGLGLVVGGGWLVAGGGKGPSHSVCSLFNGGGVRGVSGSPGGVATLE